MEFHDHDRDQDDDEHVDTFDTHQVDALVLEINEIYRAGELVKDGSGGAIPPTSNVCDSANIIVS